MIFGLAFLIGSFITVVNISVLKTSEDVSIAESVVETKTAPIYQPISDFRPDDGFEFSSKPSKEFEDIIWLSIITGSPVGYGSACAPEPCTPPTTPSVEERVNWIQQTPRGLLVTNDDVYGWKVESLSVENFSFVTNIHKGKSYKFVGRFFSDGNFEKNKPEGVILTGSLIKLVNGKAVAEENVSLKWFNFKEIDQQTFRRIKSKK